MDLVSHKTNSAEKDGSDMSLATSMPMAVQIMVNKRLGEKA
jgi:hypothetical protein